jgi:hypothetical protein
MQRADMGIMTKEYMGTAFGDYDTAFVFGWLI